MSGIPIYTSSPINASKASGVTPQTATSQEQTPRNPIPATVTATFPSAYPPAQPGAFPYPGPTAAPNAQVPPLLPTPTTRGGDEGPPRPQPGVAPTPASRTTMPPPPKSGEKYRPQITGTPVAPPATGQPSQMGIPPPTQHRAQPQGSSTSTTNTASASYPVAIPSAEFGAPRRSFEHPPNYQQNVFASELTSDQRRAQEANTSRIGAQDTSESVGGMDFLNTAKKWAQHAGERISEAEAEVWRRINKEE
jgi:hypothetical protein